MASRSRRDRSGASPACATDDAPEVARLPRLRDAPYRPLHWYRVDAVDRLATADPPHVRGGGFPRRAPGPGSHRDRCVSATCRWRGPRPLTADETTRTRTDRCASEARVVSRGARGQPRWAGSSGKSSAGAGAALELGYRFLDTGVLYRALAWLARRPRSRSRATPRRSWPWFPRCSSSQTSSGSCAASACTGSDVTELLHAGGRRGARSARWRASSRSGRRFSRSSASRRRRPDHHGRPRHRDGRAARRGSEALPGGLGRRARTPARRGARGGARERRVARARGRPAAPRHRRLARARWRRCESPRVRSSWGATATPWPTRSWRSFGRSMLAEPSWAAS